MAAAPMEMAATVASADAMSGQVAVLFRRRLMISVRNTCAHTQQLHIKTGPGKLKCMYFIPLEVTQVSGT